jgi:hypothetical protein
MTQARQLADFSPSTSPTLTGTETLTNKTLTGLKLTKTAPSISTGVVTLDLATANVFAVSLNANITSFTVTNIPTTGTYAEFAIELTADGTARTVTWTFQGVGVKWASGTAPSLTSTNGKKDTFVFYGHSGGTEWMAFKAGQNL